VMLRQRAKVLGNNFLLSGVFYVEDAIAQPKIVGFASFPAQSRVLT
jgi:hypothetical protein